MGVPMQDCRRQSTRRCRPAPPSGCRRSPASGIHPGVLLGDAGLLTGERQALSLAYKHLDLAQHHDDLLGAKLPTSGHSGLLWFELILSISRSKASQSGQSISWIAMPGRKLSDAIALPSPSAQASPGSTG